MGFGKARLVVLQMMDQRPFEDDVPAGRRQAGCRGIALLEGDPRKTSRLLACGGDHLLGEVDTDDLGAKLVPCLRIDAAAAADIGHALARGIDDAPDGLHPTGIGLPAGIGAPIPPRVEIALAFR